MKQKLKAFIRRLGSGKLSPVFAFCYGVIIWIEYGYFQCKWFFSGARKPDKEAIENVCRNVTFIYKSFERQAMAKRLYRNIQSYYPGVKVIIADDSHQPLELSGPRLQVIQLPFNSGLGFGLNRALEKVDTPFVIRMDDDELLTPMTNFHHHLDFLQAHPEVDLAAVTHLSAPNCVPPEQVARTYFSRSMSGAPKRLKIPHLTQIDKNYIVLGKTPNVFIARTEKMQAIGYDDHIRMLDHNEFFYRAAGNLVCVANPSTFVFHYHNIFDAKYQAYRSDVNGDRLYIIRKHNW